MKTKRNALSMFLLCTIWLINLSCSKKMDEESIREYFNESPAVTLYAYCFFDKEQPDLKKDFLGYDRHYYYKAYNYKIEKIEDLEITKRQIKGKLILLPTNETEACKRYDEQKKHTPHKAQLETSMPCSFTFTKIDDDWELTSLLSDKYIRTYWQVKYKCSGSKWHDLIELDNLRHRKNKNYEY